MCIRDRACIEAADVLEVSERTTLSEPSNPEMVAGEAAAEVNTVFKLATNPVI